VGDVQHEPRAQVDEELVDNLAHVDEGLIADDLAIGDRDGDGAAPVRDDSILRLDHVVGGYGSTTILHETTFDVRRGAITTVIGPNGAGKSTALKAVLTGCC
jgi:ABC-type molybdenum transport system ATPase subunit/photorepair protein PhrA